MKKILILFLVISAMSFSTKITKEKGVNISKIEMENRKNDIIGLVNQVIDMDYKNKFELNYGDDQGVISTNEVINKKIKEKSSVTIKRINFLSLDKIEAFYDEKTPDIVSLITTNDFNELIKKRLEQETGLKIYSENGVYAQLSEYDKGKVHEIYFYLTLDEILKSLESNNLKYKLNSQKVVLEKINNQWTTKGVETLNSTNLK
jgi:hypothetical protein